MLSLPRIAAGLCLAVFMSAACWAQPRVFVVESYHSDYPWDQDYRRAIQERLGKRTQLSYYAMDTSVCRRPSTRRAPTRRWRWRRK